MLLVENENRIQEQSDKLSVLPTIIRIFGYHKLSKCHMLYVEQRPQCANVRILLSRRFYVKSIWRILEVQNLPFNTFQGSEFLIF